MKILKKLTLRNIFQSFFYALEDRGSYLIRVLRFHSKIKQPNILDDIKEEYIEMGWFKEPYLSRYKALAGKDELEGLDFSKNETTLLKSAVISDFYIDGNIKAPIRRTDQTILSFQNEKRLKWGDTYPQPFYVNVILDGTLIFIPNIENYYHLMMEYILPAIDRLRLEPLLENGKVTFVSQRDLPILDFFCGYLNSIGYTASVYRLKTYHRVSGRRLILGRAAPRDQGCYFCFVRLMLDMDAYIDREISGILVPKNVFIERTGTPRRRIINQAEVIKKLRDYNFEGVSLSYDNYLFQIALFRKAEIILSVHGASLTNLIWSRSQDVIEIFPENLRPKHYLNISAQLGLKYHAIFGEKTQVREDFNLPFDRLEKILRATIHDL